MAWRLQLKKLEINRKKVMAWNLEQRQTLPLAMLTPHVTGNEYPLERYAI